MTGDIELKEPKRIVSVEPEVYERVPLVTEQYLDYDRKLLHLSTALRPQVTVHELGSSGLLGCWSGWLLDDGSDKPLRLR